MDGMRRYDAGQEEVRMADLIGNQTSAKMSAPELTAAFVRVPCHVAEGPEPEIAVL